MKEIKPNLFTNICKKIRYGRYAWAEHPHRLSMTCTYVRSCIRAAAAPRRLARHRARVGYTVQHQDMDASHASVRNMHGG
jgi:hypothetical protein